MENTINIDRGQNLFTTSTHTGHHYRPGTYFPSSNFKTVLMQPIPCTLNVKDQVLPNVHFQTTTNVFHDNKFPNQEIYNDPLSLRQTKALPSYKVNYVYDVVEKLNSKPRRPLTMGFQKSEYKQQYEDIESELAYEFDRPIHAKTYLDFDEKNDQQTKIAYDGNVQPDIPPRKPIDPSQTGVLNLLDPYLSTYNKNHKKWTNDELKNQAKNDVITIYNDENINKADYAAKIPCSSDQMKDDIWFKTQAKSRNVHNPVKFVPHRGILSETREMFTVSSDVKAKEAKICPIQTPFVLPDSSSKVAFATSQMYKTEYMNIGIGRPVQTNK